MNLQLDLQLAASEPAIPAEPQFRRWATAALKGRRGEAELALRIVDEQEGRQLNRDYRGKDYATNVLTFAYNEGEEIGPEEVTQADIILCTDVLEREAAEQKKTVEEHTAHLIVHGVLHAQGYDHEGDDDAHEMEQFERDIMEALGYPDPYDDPP